MIALSVDNISSYLVLMSEKWHALCKFHMLDMFFDELYIIFGVHFACKANFSSNTL